MSQAIEHSVKSTEHRTASCQYPNRTHVGGLIADTLISRAVALSAAVLLHVLFLLGFLSSLHVGLTVVLHPDAHPSESQNPIIASIISMDTPTSVAASSVRPINAESLTPTSPRIEIPTPSPVWPSEDNGAPLKGQPAPSAGRTGLRCEIHIHQSLTGRVQAIDFGECTGDVVWQHTLLQTIERAAQLIDPTPEAQYPPVRTLTVSTNNLSPIVLAQQLSSIEMFENETSSRKDRAPDSQ